jgi:5'-nucleotidase (lipoprotein e(P4) family)
VRSSAEYRALTIMIYRQALAAVTRSAADRPAGSWAVALDADDTVIDNTGFAREQELTGRKYEPEQWAEWVKRRARPPVPGAVAFLRAVHATGGKIAIVTNTVQELCDDTAANLQADDLVFDVMLCRSDPREVRKESRWRRIAEGSAKPGLGPVEIVAWVGDNITDFPDLSQALRLQPEAAYAAFGERYFVLPNPVYGSWESNPQE